MSAKSQPFQLQLTNFDGDYSQQMQFRYDQKTTIQDLIRFLKEKIDKDSDYKIYLSDQPQSFERNKNFFLFQILQNNQVVRYQKCQQYGTQYSANSSQNLKRCSNSVHNSQTSQLQQKSLSSNNTNNYYQLLQPTINNQQKNLNINQCSNCKKLEEQVETLKSQLRIEKENTTKQFQSLKDYYEIEIFNLKNEINLKIDIINSLNNQRLNYQNQKGSQSNSTITPSQIIQKSKVQQNNTNQSLIKSILQTSQLQTINYIKLKCGHQQDMRELEQIVQQSTYSKQAPKCKMCKQNLSSIDLKQLGNLGDQYIMIKAETNLADLFAQLKQLKLALGKCSNNQCSFFCIQQQQNRLPQNNTYCPSCLSNTVNLCKRN